MTINQFIPIKFKKQIIEIKILKLIFGYRFIEICNIRKKGKIVKIIFEIMFWNSRLDLGS